MIYFGKYLKDYLEYSNISQTEFAMRMGITQKHMNEILNGKTNITLEMAANIERLTGIKSSFIISVENSRILKESILKEYGNLQHIKEEIIKKYYINELKKRKWIKFKDETDELQICIDLLDFLKIKDFEVVPKLEEQVLFKKSGNDFNKIALWIARCDEIIKEQDVNEYNSYNLMFLIKDLKELAYKEGFELEKIKEVLNKYGIYFVCEKALPGTKIRGCFKVKGKQPAVYVTDNYAGKDSFFFELFHELGHCKSDYNEGKNKIIIDGNEKKEEKADKFALEVMIPENVWNEIINGKIEKNKLEKISQTEKIPMSFIVGRLAKKDLITYRSRLYQDNYQK
ncbi:MAG: helix-turn-helix domain-containing protein [Clostridia bacterium]|jgi:DNA-binding helix-turn-helix protein